MNRVRAFEIVRTIALLARLRAASMTDIRIKIVIPDDFIAELAWNEFPAFKKFLLSGFGESDEIQKLIGSDGIYEVIPKNESDTEFSMTIRKEGSEKYYSFVFEGNDTECALKSHKSN